MELHYYCWDYIESYKTNPDEDPLCEYESKQEFLEWVMNNREWAKDGGDKVPSKKAVLKQFDTEDDTDIDLNGFNFLQSRLDKEEARKAYYD